MSTNFVQQEHPDETVERCSKAGADWLGDRVAFALPRGAVDVPRQALRAVFERHGLGEHLTVDPRPETLLKSAAKSGTQPRGYLTREFVSPNPDTPLAIHITRVEGSDESGDSYTCLARVRIAQRQDAATGTMLAFATAKPPEGQTEILDGEAESRAVWIANETNHLLAHIKGGEASLATRRAVESIGAIKSMGGGNNYWVAPGIARAVHGFLADLQAELGLHYERFPATTFGSKQERATFQAAAQASLSDAITELRGELAAEIEESANPTLNKRTGKPRSRTATRQRKLDTARELRGKLDLYGAVIGAKLLEPLEQLRGQLEQHFNTLLDGGIPGGDWGLTEEPEPAAGEPAPASAASSQATQDPFEF